MFTLTRWLRVPVHTGAFVTSCASIHWVPTDETEQQHMSCHCQGDSVFIYQFIYYFFPFFSAPPVGIPGPFLLFEISFAPGMLYERGSE